MGTPRRVLVTGADGQVGRALVPRFEAAGWETMGCGRGALDIADRDRVLAVISEFRPDAVVNMAADNRVDAAESDPEPAYRVNALGVRHLAEASDRVGARLCHASTDYVFDGAAEEPYDEWATPAPINRYGASKRAGELELDDRAILVRAAWVAGPRTGIVGTIRRAAADPDRQLAFVTDQWGSPVLVPDLADTVVRLVSEGHRGTFHVTNDGATSWYDYARSVLWAAGEDPERVTPITTAEMDPPRPAPRPRASALRCRALSACGLGPLRHHRDALADLVGGDDGRGPP